MREWPRQIRRRCRMRRQVWLAPPMTRAWRCRGRRRRTTVVVRFSTMRCRCSTVLVAAVGVTGATTTFGRVGGDELCVCRAVEWDRVHVRRCRGGELRRDGRCVGVVGAGHPGDGAGCADGCGWHRRMTRAWRCRGRRRRTTVVVRFSTMRCRCSTVLAALLVGCDGGDDASVGSAATSYVFAGLSNGTEYTFAVAAVNAAGTGALSELVGAGHPGR